MYDLSPACGMLFLLVHSVQVTSPVPTFPTPTTVTRIVLDRVALPSLAADRADASQRALGRNSVGSNTRPIIEGQRTHEPERLSPITPKAGKTEKKGIFKKFFNQVQCTFSHDGLGAIDNRQHERETFVETSEVLTEVTRRSDSPSSGF